MDTSRAEILGMGKVWCQRVSDYLPAHDPTHCEVFYESSVLYSLDRRKRVSSG